MMTKAETETWRKEIEGWSWDILPFYEALIPALPPFARFVEIGVFCGRSSLFLAERLWTLERADVDVWGVDPFPGYVWDKFCEHLNRTDPAVRRLPHPLRMTSLEGAKFFADGSLDVVFIDGDHSEDAVRADIQAWRPKLKRGGLLCGHDYDAPHSVKVAVDDLVGAVTIEDSVWWARLP